jgi:hypothetical protein
MKISISYPPIISAKGVPLISQNTSVLSTQVNNNVQSFNTNRIEEVNEKRVSGFSKGHIPWNKGKNGVYSEETLSKLRRPKTEEHKRNLSLSRLEKFSEITKTKIRTFNENIKGNKKCKIAFGEILGTIPSDGYFKKIREKLFHYILASKDREFVERISRDFAEFGVETNVLRRSSGLWYVQVSRNWFDAFLPYLERENGKWLFSSRVVDSSSKEFKAAVIRSFVDAEGSVTCTIKDMKYYGRHISIYNSSQILLFQIKKMLSEFGISSSFYLCKLERNAIMNGVSVNFPRVYNLQITNYENLNLFHDSIGFGIPRKMKKLEEIIGSYLRIHRYYTTEDYKNSISLYEQLKNCKAVARQLSIPCGIIQNWALHGAKPRSVKMHLNNKVPQ